MTNFLKFVAVVIVVGNGIALPVYLADYAGHVPEPQDQAVLLLTITSLTNGLIFGAACWVLATVAEQVRGILTVISLKPSQQSPPPGPPSELLHINESCK